MPTPFDDWFVQLGLGVFLGPMPMSDVRQLAESGALLKTDRVRHASADDWTNAEEVPGLFGPAPDEWLSLPDESSIPAFEVVDELPSTSADGTATSRRDDEERTDSEYSDDDEVFFADDDEVFFAEDDEGLTLKIDDDESLTLAPVSEPEVLPAKSRKVQKAPSIRAADVLADAPPAPEIKLAPRPLALARPSAREVPPAPKPETHDFEYSFPKPPSPKPLPSTPVAEALDGPTASAPPAPEAAAIAPVTQMTPAVPPYSPPREERPFNAAPTVRPLPAFGAASRPAAKSASRSLPNWLKATLLAAAFVGLSSIVWLVWPSAEPDIYSQYRVIYEDLKRFRSGKAEGQWADFVKRARQTTGTTIPWLESTTKPGERNKDLLLYVGRDLQAALDVAPESEFDHEARLDGFMSQLRESYETP